MSIENAGGGAASSESFAGPRHVWRRGVVNKEREVTAMGSLPTVKLDWPWFVQFLGTVFYGDNWPPLPARLHPASVGSS